MPIERSINMADEDDEIEMTEPYIRQAPAEEERKNGSPVVPKHEAELYPPPIDNLSGDGAGDDNTLTEFEDERIGIPIDEVLKHLHHRTQSSQLYGDLVKYIPFLVMFCFFFFAGRDITANYYVVRVIKDRLMGNEFPDVEIEKKFADIANAQDYSAWVETVAVPNVWDCSDPEKHFSQLYLQGQNNLLGALRFRTHRVHPNSCKINSKLFRNPDDYTCYSEWSTGTQETSPRFHFPNPVDYPGYKYLIKTDDDLWHVEYPSEAVQLAEVHLGLNGTNYNFSSLGATATASNGTDPELAIDGDKDTKWVDAAKGNLTISFSSATTVDRYTFTTAKDGSNLRDPVRWLFLGSNDSTTWVVLDDRSGEDYDTPLEQGTSVPWILLTAHATFRHYRYHFVSLRDSVMRDTPEKPFLYKHQDCEHTGPTGIIVGDIDQYHCGGYIVDVPFNASCETVTDLTRAFASDNYPFFDNFATRLLVVEFFVHSMQLHTFTSVKVFNEQAAGGSWVNKWQIRTFIVWTEKQVGQTVYDFFFLAFVLYFWYRFFVDWVSFYRGHPPGNRKTRGRIFLYLFGFWEILDLTNLVTFSVVFGIRFAWWGTSLEANNVRFPFPDHYPSTLDKLLNLYMMQVYANAVNTVITFLKFLKYVRLNSRLNILSSTISLKAADMASCLFMFVYVVLAYALTGYALFGSNLNDYRNLDTSYSTLNRMLLGDFDYESIRSQNRFLAGIFFWTFVVMGLFLLLNFLIAILSEGFAQVSETKVDIPLDEQLTKFWTDVKRTLHPTRLCTGIKMACTGQSRGKLLERATIQLEDYKVLMEDVGDASENETISLIYKSELPTYIGEDTYDRLGKEYVDDVWDDILYDWSLTQKNDELQEEKEQMEIIYQAVRGAIKGQLDEVSNMWNKMQSLQDELNSLLSLLQTSRGG